MTRPVSADKATQQALDVQYYNWFHGYLVRGGVRDHLKVVVGAHRHRLDPAGVLLKAFRMLEKEWPAVGNPLPDHLDHALHAGVQSITKQSYPSVSDSTVELVVQQFMAAVGVQTRSVLVTVGNYVRDMPEGDRNVLMNRARGDVLIRAVAYAVGPDSPDHYQPGQLAQQAAALREAQAGIFSNSPPSKEEAYYHTPFLAECLAGSGGSEACSGGGGEACSGGDTASCGDAGAGGGQGGGGHHTAARAAQRQLSSYPRPPLAPLGTSAAAAGRKPTRLLAGPNLQLPSALELAAAAARGPGVATAPRAPPQVQQQPGGSSSRWSLQPEVQGLPNQHSGGGAGLEGSGAAAGSMGDGARPPPLPYPPHQQHQHHQQHSGSGGGLEGSGAAAGGMGDGTRPPPQPYPPHQQHQHHQHSGGGGLEGSGAAAGGMGDGAWPPPLPYPPYQQHQHHQHSGSGGGLEGSGAAAGGMGDGARPLPLQYPPHQQHHQHSGGGRGLERVGSVTLGMGDGARPPPQPYPPHQQHQHHHQHSGGGGGLEGSGAAAGGMRGGAQLPPPRPPQASLASSSSLIDSAGLSQLESATCRDDDKPWEEWIKGPGDEGDEYEVDDKAEPDRGQAKASKAVAKHQLANIIRQKGLMKSGVDSMEIRRIINLQRSIQKKPPTRKFYVERWKEAWDAVAKAWATGGNKLPDSDGIPGSRFKTRKRKWETETAGVGTEEGAVVGQVAEGSGREGDEGGSRSRWMAAVGRAQAAIDAVPINEAGAQSEMKALRLLAGELMHRVRTDTDHERLTMAYKARFPRV